MCPSIPFRAAGSSDREVKQCRACVAKSGIDLWPSRLGALIAVCVSSQVLPLCDFSERALGTRVIWV